jgi:hypothetical protein
MCICSKFPVVIANIVSNTMEEYNGQWPPPMLRRQNAMPYGGHASAFSQAMQSSEHAASNVAGPAENVSLSSNMMAPSSGYQFLGDSSILHEQPDTSRPPPGMYNMPVEMNSASVPTLPSQHSAPNNRGNVIFPKTIESNKQREKLSFSFLLTVGNWLRVQMPSAPPFLSKIRSR